MLTFESETLRPGDGAKAAPATLQTVVTGSDLDAIRVIRQGRVAIRIEKGRVVICDIDPVTPAQLDGTGAG
jgi:hypothetical protein